MSPKPPAVTLIMPAYNNEAYVARAVESVQNQTLRDWELIVVDDGSTDRTGQILDRLASRDWRIEVIHTENHGAAAARNTALDRARGRYIHFLDGDDWVESAMLEREVAFAEANDLELVVAGFYIETFYGNGGEHLAEAKRVDGQVFATRSEFRSQAFRLFDQNLLYVPWNKLFLRGRIEEMGLRFRPTFWDDFPFVLDYIRDVGRVGVMGECFYHFGRSRAESETARWRPGMYEKREEEHGWMLDLYDHWGLSADPSSVEMVQRRYIERLVGCIENVCNDACTLPREEKRAQIEAMISTPRAQMAVELAQPRSAMMRAMLMPIRRKDASMAMLEGRVISLVKGADPRLFASLKARR